MQKNTASLICTLICLGVVAPMLTGCRYNGGPKHHFSSWEMYNPLSKSKSSSDIDDTALARQFDEPQGLPKADVTPPRDGYLTESRGTRLAVSDTNGRGSNALSDSGGSALAQKSNAAGRENVATAKPQAAESLFDHSGTSAVMASSGSQTPQYGTVSPIEPGFGSTGSAGQMAAANPSPNMNPQVGAYSGMPMQDPMSTPNYANGMYANGMYANATAAPTGQVGQMPYNPGTSTYGQQPGQSTAYTMANTTNPANTTYNPNATAQNANVYAGMTTPNTSPQMVASNQGTGYGGQGMDYMGMPTTNMTMANSTGTTNPATGYPAQATTMQGMPVQGDYGYNNMPAAAGTQTGVAGQQQPSQTAPGQGMTIDMNSAGTTGYYPPGQQGIANPASTNATGMTPTFPSDLSVQQPTNNAYQNGFNYFAPAGDDAYRPGAGY